MNTPSDSNIKSILVPVLIALIFLFWGCMIYFVVGNRGPGFWFYGSQPDVPGQSIYSTQRAKLFPGSGPEALQRQIRPQHVDGGTTGPIQKLPQEVTDGNP